jgi:hypothetical protein
MPSSERQAGWTGAVSRLHHETSGTPERDTGLRQLLTWTFVVLVLVVLLALGLVQLVTYLFDRPL